MRTKWERCASLTKTIMYADQVQQDKKASGVGGSVLKSTGLLSGSSSSKSKNKRRGVGSASEDTSMNDADAAASRRSQIRNKSNPLARPSTSARPKKVSLNSQSSKSSKPSGDRGIIDVLTRFLQSRYDSNLNFLNLEVSGLLLMV